MQMPLQIAFRNMESSAAIEARVRERAKKLDQYHNRIMSCRVVVESPHRHRHQGKVFHVRIDLTVPQGEIVVNREPEENHAHEDVFVAIRDAFDAMQRRLQDYAHQQRGAVKTHEPTPRGRIARYFADDGYGFIATPDGREIYFHRNAVVGADFAELEVGTLVEFVEELGEQGPQASTVRLAAST
jgi:ribosomal subunit interface protein